MAIRQQCFWNELVSYSVTYLLEYICVIKSENLFAIPWTHCCLYWPDCTFIKLYYTGWRWIAYLTAHNLTKQLLTQYHMSDYKTWIGVSTRVHIVEQHVGFCNSIAIEKVGIIQSERKQNPMVPDRQQCRPLAADNQTAKLTNINQEAASMKTS